MLVFSRSWIPRLLDHADTKLSLSGLFFDSGASFGIIHYRPPKHLERQKRRGEKKLCTALLKSETSTGCRAASTGDTSRSVQHRQEVVAMKVASGLLDAMQRMLQGSSAARSLSHAPVEVGQYSLLGPTFLPPATLFFVSRALVDSICRRSQLPVRKTKAK